MPFLANDEVVRRKNRRGFSLVEVVISATMLLLGISGLVMGVHIAVGQHEHNRKLAQALVIAEKRMEALLLLFPTSSELSDGRHPEGGFELLDGRALALTVGIHERAGIAGPRGIGHGPDGN